VSSVWDDLQGARPESVSLIADYPGRCPECHIRFPAGTPITRMGDGWVHASCWRKAPSCAVCGRAIGTPAAPATYGGEPAHASCLAPGTAGRDRLVGMNERRNRDGGVQDRVSQAVYSGSASNGSEAVQQPAGAMHAGGRTAGTVEALRSPDAGSGREFNPARDGSATTPST
jgi:hypothetical protein